MPPVVWLGTNYTCGVSARHTAPLIGWKQTPWVLRIVIQKWANNLREINTLTVVEPLGLAN